MKVYGELPLTAFFHPSFSNKRSKKSNPSSFRNAPKRSREDLTETNPHDPPAKRVRNIIKPDDEKSVFSMSLRQSSSASTTISTPPTTPTRPSRLSGMPCTPRSIRVSSVAIRSKPLPSPLPMLSLRSDTRRPKTTIGHEDSQRLEGTIVAFNHENKKIDKSPSPPDHDYSQGLVSTTITEPFHVLIYCQYTVIDRNSIHIQIISTRQSASYLVESCGSPYPIIRDSVSYISMPTCNFVTGRKT